MKVIFDRTLFGRHNGNSVYGGRPISVVAWTSYFTGEVQGARIDICFLRR